MGAGSASSSSSVTRELRAESMSVSVSCYQERRDCKSLLFSLLWYIGGAPPVLRNRGEGLLKARVTNVRWLLPLLILNCLFLSSSAKSHSPWCGQTLDQQVIKKETLWQMPFGKYRIANFEWQMSHDKCHMKMPYKKYQFWTNYHTGNNFGLTLFAKCT